MSEARTSGRTRPNAAGLTDVGRQRRHNEDHLLLRPDLGIFVVADGMGGHNAGDVASKLTTTSLTNFYEATKTGEIPPDFLSEITSEDPGARRLIAGIKKANRDVFVISTTHAQHHGMGSTVVAIDACESGKVHIGHVGDSRCYRLRDGKIELLTRDHSLINDAIELKPDLTPDEIARLPKNIITRALGMKDQVKVDVRTEETRVGDVFLLCSDGLSGMISDREIEELIKLTDEPVEACALLVGEANGAGGTDNISALIVKIEADDEKVSIDWNDITSPMFDKEPTTKKPPVVVAAPAAEDDAPVTPKPAAAKPASASASSSPAIVISEAIAKAPAVAGLPKDALPQQAIEKLAKGEEIDLELRGPWSKKPTFVPRCPKCRHEIFPDNQFCVECGAEVVHPSAGT